MLHNLTLKEHKMEPFFFLKPGEHQKIELESVIYNISDCDLLNLDHLANLYEIHMKRSHQINKC